MKSKIAGTFQSIIASRNYRLYASGQAISLAGSWMQTVAQGWLVLQLTGSSTQAGLVVAFQFIPVLLLAPLGGLIVDRMNTRNILIVSQTIAASLALLLGVVTVTHHVHLWMIYGIALLVGIVTTVDNPARQTFVLELVGPENLTNAITLNSVNINLARAVGPAIGAVIISTVGVGQCFLVNAGSFLFVIYAMLRMRPAEFYPKKVAIRAKGQVREGFRYVARTPALRTPLVMMALIGTLAYEFQVSLLASAKYTFHGSATTYGVMTASLGVGAVIGGLATASKDRRGLGAVVSVSALFGVALVALALAPNLTVMVIALVVTGGVSITFLARANSTLQLAADPAMRGRVMALWTVAFLGSTPVGGPAIGWIAEHVGARWALATGAAACLVAAAYGAWHLRAEKYDEMMTAAAATSA